MVIKPTNPIFFLINPVKVSVHPYVRPYVRTPSVCPYVRTSTIELSAATNQMVVFVRVYE